MLAGNGFILDLQWHQISPRMFAVYLPTYQRLGTQARIHHGTHLRSNPTISGLSDQKIRAHISRKNESSSILEWAQAGSLSARQTGPIADFLSIQFRMGSTYNSIAK